MSNGWATWKAIRKRDVASGLLQPLCCRHIRKILGIAVAEALAAGLPCVVSRGVALSDEIEKAGAGIVVGTTPRGYRRRY